MPLMILSLVLQNCLTCLVHLIWMVLEMGIKWSYRCCFMGCCFSDSNFFFNIAHCIFVRFPSSFFSRRFVNSMCYIRRVVLTTAARKKSRLILSNRSDVHSIDSLLIAVQTFGRHMLISLSVDETLHVRYINLSSDFSKPSYRVEMSLWFKHIYSVLSVFTWRPMSPATCSRLWSMDSAWIGVFSRSPMSSA